MTKFKYSFVKVLEVLFDLFQDCDIEKIRKKAKHVLRKIKFLAEYLGALGFIKRHFVWPPKKIPKLDPDFSHKRARPFQWVRCINAKLGIQLILHGVNGPLITEKHSRTD